MVVSMRGVRGFSLVLASGWDGMLMGWYRAVGYNNIQKLDFGETRRSLTIDEETLSTQIQHQLQLNRLRATAQLYHIVAI